MAQRKGKRNRIEANQSKRHLKALNETKAGEFHSKKFPVAWY